MAENYIKRLERENAELQEQIAAARALVVDFEAHLTTSKFWEDPTIQVGDVVTRLRAIKMGLL